ncbi:MAG TPA: hypothetical protein DDW49_00130 [Deltaproteobacteria bacterium]|nr:MAG: hypothetical protein A2048_01115 [Deltaproteobacteria bacterium GWA2_45_12]HBF11795.1 hypothetical protein [Deltaproteobacteria bacterium]
MKIKKVHYNNRKKSFEIETKEGKFEYPYSRLLVKPTFANKIKSVFVDQELGREGFTYTFEKGGEQTILMDQVLEYNGDTDYLKNMLLYKLTVKAQKALHSKKISKRELARRLGTSPTHLYRLLDQTFYGKTIDQMVKLLSMLDCPVDVVFKKAA